MTRAMEGQLSEHPFAELISEILEKKVSGALRVERERVRAVVYFEKGALVYATSNLRNLRLNEYLKKRGVSVESLSGDSLASDFAAAKSLLAARLTTQPVLDEATAEQVTDVMRVLVLWTSGNWSLDERARLTEPVRVEISLEQLLLDASKRLDPQFAASRLASGQEISRGVISASDLKISAIEGYLLSRVDGPTQLDDLVTVSGMPEVDARRTIYGFVLAGLLRRQLYASAFTTGDPKQTVESRKPPVQKPKPPPPPPRDPAEEVVEFLEVLGRANNHYEVLNIPPSSTESDVKGAYYALARRYHPDRFHFLVDTPLHSQLESAFARITQAHETLSDPKLKASYDTKIAAFNRAGQIGADAARRSGTTEAPTGAAGNLQQAELRFKEGVAALDLGDANTATACLSAAARLVPGEPRYRAYYGRALAAHPQTKRLAEGELQAAVKLDPNNASYRVMLATLYRDLGFWRRAISELERALSLDSKNVEARRMLESLETKK